MSVDSFLADDQIVEGQEVVTGDGVEAQSPTPGVETAKEPEAPPSPAPEVVDQDPDKGFKAALLDERRKRQDLERQLQEVTKEKEPEKTFWEDPEEAIQKVKAETAEMVARERVNWSEMAARDRHKEDFDAAIEEFTALAMDDPRFIEAMKNHHDPAEYAFQVGTRHMKLKEIGDPKEYEAKLTAKIKADLEKTYEAKFNERIEAAIKERLKIPSSLTGVQSGKEPEIDTGPTPLTELVKRK